MKTKNPSACVTVKWEVCRVGMSSALPVVPSSECERCNKSNHPIQTQSVVAPTGDSILTILLV
jgi:hypothetical protein